MLSVLVAEQMFYLCKCLYLYRLLLDQLEPQVEHCSCRQQFITHVGSLVAAPGWAGLAREAVWRLAPAWIQIKTNYSETEV